MTAKEWAQLLVDNVATATQLDPDKDELPNVEDWRRNAEGLFRQILEQHARDMKIVCDKNAKLTAGVVKNG